MFPLVKNDYGCVGQQSVCASAHFHEIRIGRRRRRRPLQSSNERPTKKNRRRRTEGENPVIPAQKAPRKTSNWRDRSTNWAPSSTIDRTIESALIPSSLSFLFSLSLSLSLLVGCVCRGVKKKDKKKWSAVAVRVMVRIELPDWIPRCPSGGLDAGHQAPNWQLNWVFIDTEQIGLFLGGGGGLTGSDWILPGFYWVLLVFFSLSLTGSLTMVMMALLPVEAGRFVFIFFLVFASQESGRGGDSRNGRNSKRNTGVASKNNAGGPSQHFVTSTPGNKGNPVKPSKTQ